MSLVLCPLVVSQTPRQSVIGQLRLVTGQMRQVTGQLRLVTGQLRLVTGQLRLVTGQLSLVTGQLRQDTGQLRLVNGQLRLVTGQLRQVTGQPRQDTGQLTQEVASSGLFVVAELRGDGDEVIDAERQQGGVEHDHGPTDRQHGKARTRTTQPTSGCRSAALTVSSNETRGGCFDPRDGTPASGGCPFGQGLQAGAASHHRRRQHRLRRFGDGASTLYGSHREGLATFDQRSTGQRLGGVVGSVASFGRRFLR